MATRVCDACSGAFDGAEWHPVALDPESPTALLVYCSTRCRDAD